MNEKGKGATDLEKRIIDVASALALAAAAGSCFLLWLEIRRGGSNPPTPGVRLFVANVPGKGAPDVDSDPVPLVRDEAPSDGAPIVENLESAN